MFNLWSTKHVLFAHNMYDYFPLTPSENKQKWVQLPIELKTERRRGTGGNRGRGASRPQYYEDQQRRNNRPTFRRPNKVRDGSRQGEETDSRGMCY